MRAGWILVAIGIALLIAGQIASVMLDHRDWPTAVGKITEARVVEKLERHGKTYQVKVKYEFEVDRKTCRGDRISILDFAWQSSDSAKADAPYAKGQQVKVYYKPDAPGKSYLEPKLSLGMHAFLWPVILVVAGCYFLAKSLFV